MHAACMYVCQLFTVFTISVDTSTSLVVLCIDCISFYGKSVRSLCLKRLLQYIYVSHSIITKVHF